MYQPKPPPINPSPQATAAYVADELQAVAQSQSDKVDFISLNVLHVAPSKPRAGVIACADGTDWNPTATGFGFYGYNGSAWVKLG
jgi:hypothetical protein